MVGDRDVSQSAVDRRPHHGAERVLAVGGGGVHVQVAANVVERDQLRQRATFRAGNLVARLAEFGRDPGQAHGSVDVLLGPSRHRRPLGGTGVGVGAGLETKHAIFVDREPPVAGPRPQPHVVLLGAGEVLPGRAERIGVHDAQVHLHAARAPDARLRVAAEQDTRTLRPGDKVVHHPRRIVTIDHDVDVPHGLSAPPPAARPLHPPHGRAVPHPGEQGLYDRIGL